MKQLLDAYLEALADPAAPTALHERGAGQKVHIADSLVGLAVDAVREARRIADLGSGAGLPGLVLAIARPEAEVVLVESVGKKCAWLRAHDRGAGAGERARRVRAARRSSTRSRSTW